MALALSGSLLLARIFDLFGRFATLKSDLRMPLAVQASLDRRLGPPEAVSVALTPGPDM